MFYSISRLTTTDEWLGGIHDPRPRQRDPLPQSLTTLRQLDQLVYELYGLTDAEIAIVEAATAG